MLLAEHADSSADVPGIGGHPGSGLEDSPAAAAQAVRGAILDQAAMRAAEYCGV